MTTTTATGLGQRIERCFREGDWDTLREVYAPDVLLDGHVPEWRFQHQGADTVLGWLVPEFEELGEYRVPWARVTETPDLVVLEWEGRTGDGADERLFRQVDLFRVEDGRVVEHTFWCTGVWDAETIARQAREAPMVRW